MDDSAKQQAWDKAQTPLSLYHPTKPDMIEVVTTLGVFKEIAGLPLVPNT